MPGTGSLTVVGTGLRAGLDTTLAARAALEAAEEVLYLSNDPFSEEWILRLRPSAASLAGCYWLGEPRRHAYQRMVRMIVAPVLGGRHVCAAFYGHPGVFVRPAHAAIDEVRRAGLDAQMLPGISAADALFADVGLDPGDSGCQSFEATDFLVHRRRFDPTSVLLLWQIGGIGRRDLAPGGRRGLEVLTGVLCESYPAEHEVTVYEANFLPVLAPRIHRVRLEALPNCAVSLRSTLFVPARPPRPPDLEVLRELGL